MLNKTIVQGRLIADPELKTVGDGVALATFRVAWSERYKDKETKLYLNCTAWRGQAEMISKYFYKGKEIVVEGRLETHTWQDQNGENRSAIDLNVDKVHFVGPKTEAPERTTEAAADAVFTDITDENEEQLPF